MQHFLRQIYIFPVFAAILLFPVVRRCRCSLKIAFSSSSLSKTPDLSLEFRCHSSKDISISGFGGRTTMSHLFGDTSFENSAVENVALTAIELQKYIH